MGFLSKLKMVEALVLGNRMDIKDNIKDKDNQE